MPPSPRRCLPGRFVDQRAEAVAGEADEYVIQSSFPGHVRRLVTLPDAVAVALTAGRAVIGQQLVEDQGFEVHQAVCPLERMIDRKVALLGVGDAERFAGIAMKLT